MNRWLALLLAIVGGGGAALAAIIAVGGGIIGILWLFVFGDDPWPAWAETFINLAVPVGGLLLWLVFGWAIYRRLVRGR